MNLILSFLICLLLYSTVTSQPCSDLLSVELFENATTFSDGTTVQKGVSFPPKYIYTKNVTGDTKKFGCLCEIKKCFRKCCPLNHIPIKRKCTYSPEMDIIMRRGINISAFDSYVETVNATMFGELNGKPCKKLYIELNPWFMQQDGTLHVMLYNRVPSLEIKTVDQYCIDTFIETDESGKVTPRLDALVCFQLDKDDNHYLLSAVCMCVSCVFILATVAVYCWLPELRNIHGKVLVAYLLSFFVGFIFLASMQISIHLNNLSNDVCFPMTFIIYYFLLAAFFWLNVMCFDIWWTFCGIRSSCLERLANMSPRNKFLAYCGYAFGVPAVLTVILTALEFSGLPRRWYLPNIKLQGCFLYGTSKLVYLYGPIIVLYVANLAFFLLTAVRIYTINKENTRVLSGSRDSATHDRHSNDKQRLFLYVKLFCVMGINWILEVVSALAPQLAHIWVYTDAYNVLIGVTIFIVFVCKRKILRLIKKRYRETKSDSYMSRTQTSSSRTLASREEIKLNNVKSDDESAE